MWRLKKGEEMHKYQTPSYRYIGRIFNCTKMVKDEKQWMMMQIWEDEGMDRRYNEVGSFQELEIG